MNRGILLRKAVDDFLLAAAADGLRPQTLKWYGAMLRALVDDFANFDVGEITTAMLRQYIVNLRARPARFAGARATRPKVEGGLSEDSIAGHIRTLHRFWRWAANEYGLPNNPMLNIRRPPRRSPDPKGIALEDVQALFKATSDDLAGARDRAMLAFLIDTGCRAQGILELELDRLDVEHRRALVTEKGQRRRTVFFTDVTARLLQAWLYVRPKTANKVFCSFSNRFYGKPLSYEGLTGILARLKEKAGVKGRVNPHSFRHGFARQYIMNGGDLATLSRLLGHSDSAVTAWYYAVFSPAELADLHNRFSPLNGLLDDSGESL